MTDPVHSEIMRVLGTPKSISFTDWRTDVVETAFALAEHLETGAFARIDGVELRYNEQVKAVLRDEVSRAQVRFWGTYSKTVVFVGAVLLVVMLWEWFFTPLR